MIISSTLLHIPKWLVIALPGLLIVFLVVSFGIGDVVAGKALAVKPQRVSYDQTVIAVNGNNYTTTGSAYNVDGIIGAIRSDGTMIGILSAPISPLTTKNDATKTSTRMLDTLMGPQPKAGDKISLQGNIWTSNPKDALGLYYKDVTYDSPLGPMGAWLVPPTRVDSTVNGEQPAVSTKWTIGVHGINGNKAEMLRFIKPVVAAGNTMLVINYRNDAGSPQSGDGYNRLGASEWQDLQAAVRYAKAHGATNISLYGDSLGGSVVENYLRRSSDVATITISHVILDSPALDWDAITSAQLAQAGYPTYLAFFTKIAIRLRAGFDLDSLNTQPSDIKQPTLIFHNADDPTVPQAASKRLAAARPDTVTLYDFGSGGHLRAWNHDRARYEQLVTVFLKH